LVRARVVGEHGELAQLVQHHLVAVVVPSDRAEALAFLERCRDGGQNKKHELH
jgi:hypothetical protein